MYFKNVKKYVCCNLDVTIGARIIGFIGIMISLLLITVLLNDTYLDKNENYDMSRKTALALGLDWQHLHPKASTSYQNDLEGKKITIIVIFYAGAFLLINMLLCFATIRSDWRFAVPWLACEFFGCVSKFGALVYHFCYDQNNLSNIFIIGSLLYIVIMIWWWIVVFLALLSWKHKNDSELQLELTYLSLNSKASKEIDTLSGRIRYYPDSVRDTSNMDSPGPYIPNMMYTLI